MKTKLTDQDKIDIVAKYLAGTSARGIGKQYGVTHKAITGILTRREIQIRK